MALQYARYEHSLETHSLSYSVGSSSTQSALAIEANHAMLWKRNPSLFQGAGFLSWISDMLLLPIRACLQPSGDKSSYSSAIVAVTCS